MPFVFAPDFGYWTPLITSFMFYVLASLEPLAEEVENPFGTDINYLPIDELCSVIKEMRTKYFLDTQIIKFNRNILFFGERADYIIIKKHSILCYKYYS